jgi:hypothetical protein
MRQRVKVLNFGECGVCGRRTERGDWFESGQRNPCTGETPCGNFICDRCQKEARVLREVSGVCDRQARRWKAAVNSFGTAAIAT